MTATEFSGVQFQSTKPTQGFDFAKGLPIHIVKNFNPRSLRKASTQALDNWEPGKNISIHEAYARLRLVVDSEDRVVIIISIHEAYARLRLDENTYGSTTVHISIHEAYARLRRFY